MSTFTLTTEQKQTIKNGESLVMHNSFDCDGDLFLLWFNDYWGLWVLEKNGKVIKATKTINPILKKLNLDGAITESTLINQ